MEKRKKINERTEKIQLIHGEIIKEDMYFFDPKPPFKTFYVPKEIIGCSYSKMFRPIFRELTLQETIEKVGINKNLMI